MTEFSVFEGCRRWLPTRRPEDDRRRRLLVLKRGFSSFAGSLRLSLGRPALAPSGAAADQIALGNLSNLSEVVRIVLILTLRATRKSVPYRFVSSFSVSRLNKKGSPIGMLSKHMGEPFLLNGPPERITGGLRPVVAGSDALSVRKLTPSRTYQRFSSDSGIGVFDYASGKLK